MKRKAKPAAWYDKFYREKKGRRSPVHDWVADRCTPVTLDVGCGDGVLLRLLADREIAARGCDFSYEAVRICRSFDYRVELLDVTDLPYDDDSFSTVACVEVLEHLDDPRPVIDRMAEIARDRVIITVPPLMKSKSHVHVRSLDWWRELIGVEDRFFDGIHAGFVLESAS